MTRPAARRPVPRRLRRALARRRVGDAGWAAWCWLFVLAAIGAVQIVRAQPVDAAVYLAAWCLTAASVLAPARQRPGRRVGPPPPVAAAAAVGRRPGPFTGTAWP